LDGSVGVPPWSTDQEVAVEDRVDLDGEAGTSQKSSTISENSSWKSVCSIGLAAAPD
jgi:hypothetical protein